MKELNSPELWGYYLSDLLGLNKEGQNSLISDLSSGKANEWGEVLEEEDVDPNIICDFCRFFKVKADALYTLELPFNGYVGATETLEIEAPYGSTEEELLDILRSDYESELDDFLKESEIVSLDDDEWQVTFNFGGYIGYDATYEVYGEDEDDAVYNAFREALWDISIDSFEVNKDEI